MYSYMAKTADPKRIPPARARQKATFNLDAGLHQRLKVTAALERRQMVELVEEALHQHLGELAKRKKTA